MRRLALLAPVLALVLTAAAPLPTTAPKAHAIVTRSHAGPGDMPTILVDSIAILGAAKELVVTCVMRASVHIVQGAKGKDLPSLFFMPCPINSADSIPSSPPMLDHERRSDNWRYDFRGILGDSSIARPPSWRTPTRFIHRYA